MTRRGTRRLLAVLAAPIAALLFGVFALGGTASAHTVTSIEANCSTVTVHFASFPSTAVSVHIEATLEGHGSVGTDVMVDSQTSVATLSISSETAALFGASGTLDVDVTWNLDGAQHVSGMFTLTCGETTTTTGATSSTTMPHETSTTVGDVTSTTQANETSTTVGGETSTTQAGGATSTTRSQGTTSTTAVSGVTVSGSGTGGAGGNGGTGATLVAGENAQLNSPGTTFVLGSSELSGTSSTANGALPFTGSSTMPLAGIAAAALALGALAAITGRRRTSISRRDA